MKIRHKSIIIEMIGILVLKELFEKQKKYLDFFFASLDFDQVDRAYKLLLDCQGTIFFTGVGKSGFIAQKIAATLVSTGTKALFLPPTDALHGDLGIVGEKDVFMMFSKSGESEEIIQLLPYIRNKGAKIIAITSQEESRLLKGSDCYVILPCQRELCPFDLAPTTSTEIQLLFGDAISIALMKEKGFSLNQFVMNHPAGQIGKRMSIKVKDLMINSTQLPYCSPDDLLENVLIDFSNKRCGCLIVVDNERKLQGIFTDGDLRRALQAKGEKVLQESIGNLMTVSPRTIDQNALAWEAMKLMEADLLHPIMVLPVLHRDEEVVGLIKMHDIIQAGI